VLLHDYGDSSLPDADKLDCVDVLRSPKACRLCSRALATEHRRRDGMTNYLDSLVETETVLNSNWGLFEVCIEQVSLSNSLIVQQVLFPGLGNVLLI